MSTLGMSLGILPQLSLSVLKSGKVAVAAKTAAKSSAKAKAKGTAKAGVKQEPSEQRAKVEPALEQFVPEVGEAKTAKKARLGEAETGQAAGVRNTCGKKNKKVKKGPKASKGLKSGKSSASSAKPEPERLKKVKQTKFSAKTRKASAQWTPCLMCLKEPKDSVSCIQSRI